MSEEKPFYNSDGEPFAFASQTQLSQDASATLHPSGVLVIKTRNQRHDQVTLDASEAWNLLQWLADNHRDRLYHLMRKAEEEKRV